MSFAGGFVPYEELFGHYEDQKPSRENWGLPPAIPVPTQKRRKATSIAAKKRARMTRGDENISDESAKRVAGELLNQIQQTPGEISLDFSSSQTAGLCPLPTEFANVVKSDYGLDRLQEGQLNVLLGQNPRKFQNLKIPKIVKGRAETQILPRQMPMKVVVEKLQSGEKWTDEYVGFAAAIANVLRRCDVQTAENVAQSITSIIEKDALPILNN